MKEIIKDLINIIQMKKEIKNVKELFVVAITMTAITHVILIFSLYLYQNTQFYIDLEKNNPKLAGFLPVIPLTIILYFLRSSDLKRQKKRK